MHFLKYLTYLAICEALVVSENTIDYDSVDVINLELVSNGIYYALGNFSGKLAGPKIQIDGQLYVSLGYKGIININTIHVASSGLISIDSLAAEKITSQTLKVPYLENKGQIYLGLSPQKGFLTPSFILTTNSTITNFGSIIAYSTSDTNGLFDILLTSPVDFHNEGVVCLINVAVGNYFQSLFGSGCFNIGPKAKYTVTYALYGYHIIFYLSDPSALIYFQPTEFVGGKLVSYQVLGFSQGNIMKFESNIVLIDYYQQTGYFTLITKNLNYSILIGIGYDLSRFSYNGSQLSYSSNRPSYLVPSVCLCPSGIPQFPGSLIIGSLGPSIGSSIGSISSDVSSIGVSTVVPSVSINTKLSTGSCFSSCSQTNTVFTSSLSSSVTSVNTSSASMMLSMSTVTAKSSGSNTTITPSSSPQVSPFAETSAFPSSTQDSPTITLTSNTFATISSEQSTSSESIASTSQGGSGQVFGAAATMDICKLCLLLPLVAFV
ncbi:hypothetical protein PUMCH_003469 [Australozyma saopauloensis]|uniref:Hyphally-regulated cell wall protein N-terminal domain-containing protein n=1 Tax=Australozyma saopauloensis TaxID=291208 RepID=A0AAX4HCF9_9ASCO|nr:hypothetical protein PUMCH_003469 [[Candida] saopauloensis]